jgi:hypothetical protein
MRRPATLLVCLAIRKFDVQKTVLLEDGLDDDPPLEMGVVLLGLPK